ncbi:MAG: hypothetical protein K2M12_10040, partial [Muribaculaceae bacterium]|nr:hypothetical protein [Muribaculaceae bacterium]
MSKPRQDIGDDEIRIITPANATDRTTTSHRRSLWLFGAMAVAVLCLIIAFVALAGRNGSEATLAVDTIQKSEVVPDTVFNAPELEKAFVEVRDTVVDGTGILVLTPIHAVPRLAVGPDALNDSSAVLVVQAADVRADNGNIAGAFVLNGDLISKGEAKSGFCAIINGEIFIGVADATP